MPVSEKDIPSLLDEITRLERERDEARKDANRFAMGLTIGRGLMVWGTVDAIGRARDVLLIDSGHSVEKEDIRRSLLRQLQAAESDNARFSAQLAKATGLLREIKDIRRSDGRTHLFINGDEAAWIALRDAFLSTLTQAETEGT